VYGGVPPDALTDALPLEAPQVAGNVEVESASTGGSVMVVFNEVEQPFASVICTE